MTLSEAILLGSTLAGQAFGGYEERHPDGKRFTCALQAATEAFGGRLALIDHCAHTLEQIAGCPACASPSRDSQSLSIIVVHLNDHHRWTRERIAEWVATVETVAPRDPSLRIMDKARFNVFFNALFVTGACLAPEPEPTPEPEPELVTA